LRVIDTILEIKGKFSKPSPGGCKFKSIAGIKLRGGQIS
jgi:hypothetical protein